MIDFALIELNTLRFINGIYAEDHHFSIILFSLSKMIYIIKSKNINIDYVKIAVQIMMGILIKLVFLYT